MFGHIMEEVIRGLTKHDELQNLYLSSYVWVIKARMVRLVGCVACMKDMRNVTKLLNRKPEKTMRCRHRYLG